MMLHRARDLGTDAVARSGGIPCHRSHSTGRLGDLSCARSGDYVFWRSTWDCPCDWPLASSWCGVVHGLPLRRSSSEPWPLVGPQPADGD
jgi:hypothetical protein